jgi:hypothetical protein
MDTAAQKSINHQSLITSVKLIERFTFAVPATVAAPIKSPLQTLIGTQGDRQ